MKLHIRLLAKKKVPAFKKAWRHTAAKRMAVKEAVRAIVELEPTPETEQRLEALAVRAKKAKEASFLDRYRASEAA